MKEGERERWQLAEERGDSGILAGTSDFGDPTTLSSTLSTFDKLIFDKLQIWKEERERRQLDEDKSESGILAGTSDSGDPTTLSTLSNTLTTLPTTLSTTLPTNE